MGWVDAAGLLEQFGLPAMFAGVALESAGLPVPGETVLVLAAVSAARAGTHGFWAVFTVAAAAAILGDNSGYLAGRFGGWPALRRYGRWLHLDESRLKVARYLFARHGGRVVFGGRFVAILRTTAAFLAGVNQMPWRRFLVFNAAGGIVWAGLWAGLAYLLGARVEQLAGPGAWLLVGAVVVGLLAGGAILKRRWRRLLPLAEAAYPGPL